MMNAIGKTGARDTEINTSVKYLESLVIGSDKMVDEIEMNDTELELVKTNLRRYTFESPKIKVWVESKSDGRVLNLFAGKTLLNLDEIRNDIDKDMVADYHMDCVDFVNDWDGPKFDTIILDPPYALRKAMEMYNGNYTSRFKMLANAIDRILAENGRIISFGYHSTFMGKVRGYDLDTLCVFAHGGAQHCTIGIIERRNKGGEEE